MGLQSDYTVGLAKETTFGTGVTPTRFFEADSTFKEKVTTVQGRGYRPSQRVARSTRRSVVKRESSGDITLDAPSVGLGLLLAAFAGSSTVTMVPTTAAYQQVHTLKTSDYLDSYTVQQGVPQLGSSTVDAYTYSGAMCDGLEISAKDGGMVEIKSSWIARALSRVTAYATPSYPAAMELLTFVGASVKLGGTLTAATTTALATSTATAAVNVREISVALKNGLDSNGFNIGAAGLRARPAAVKGGSEDAITGTFVAEYTDRTYVDAYLDQTDLALVLMFESTAEIATGIKACLQVVIPTIRLEGDVPTGNKGDVITVSHSFKGLATGSAQPVQLVYRSLDTAV